MHRGWANRASMQPGTKKPEPCRNRAVLAHGMVRAVPWADPQATAPGREAARWMIEPSIFLRRPAYCSPFGIQPTYKLAEPNPKTTLLCSLRSYPRLAVPPPDAASPRAPAAAPRRRPPRHSPHIAPQPASRSRAAAPPAASDPLTTGR